MLVLLYVTVVSDVQVKTFIVLILTVAVINGFLLLWLSFLVADCVLLSSLYPLSVVSVVSLCCLCHCLSLLCPSVSRSSPVEPCPG